jgi:hypothetical protein
MDSAIFNQEPPKGVYSTMMPCCMSQLTMLGVLCPFKLSQIHNIRSDGSSEGSRGGAAKSAHQSSHSARFVSESSSTSGGGRVARIAVSSCCNQACKTRLGAWVTPRTRTWPLKG